MRASVVFAVLLGCASAHAEGVALLPMQASALAAAAAAADLDARTRVPVAGPFGAFLDVDDEAGATVDARIRSVRASAQLR